MSSSCRGYIQIYYHCISQEIRKKQSLLVLLCLLMLVCVLFWLSWLLLLIVVGNEFGEPVIEERQIRIADNPLSFLGPSGRHV